MSETLLIVITALLFMLVLCFMALTGIIGFHFYKSWQKNEPTAEEKEKIAEAQLVHEEAVSKNQDPTISMATGYCHNHHTEKAVATCGICGDLLCEECVREYETLNFCPEHFDLYIRHDWDVVETVKTTPNEAHKSFYLYDFKKREWEKNQTATYIMTHYKIDVTSDEIESHISLYGIREEITDLKDKVKKGVQ